MTREDYNFLTTTMSKVLALNNKNEKLEASLKSSKTNLRVQKQKKKKLENEERDALGSEGTKDKLAERAIEAKKQYGRSTRELTAINKKVERSKSKTWTEEAIEQTATIIISVGCIIGFILSGFVVIPFDDIGVMESECSETGETYGSDGQPLPECDWDSFDPQGFGAFSCCVYFIIVGLFGGLFYLVMWRKSGHQVRLHKAIEDEAASKQKQKAREKGDMDNINRRLNVVERLEKSIPELEFETKLLEKNIVAGEKALESSMEEINELLASVNHLTPYYDKLNL